MGFLGWKYLVAVFIALVSDPVELATSCNVMDILSIFYHIFNFWFAIINLQFLAIFYYIFNFGSAEFY
jgi:uncharacterized membrane protein